MPGVLVRTAAAAGALAAGVAAGGALERAVVRRLIVSGVDPDDGSEAIGSLHGTPVVVVADDDVALHAEIDEPDDPRNADLTVVFSHGYALNLDSWHFERRDLRGTARLVFWDQRSHGRSGRASVAGHVIDQLGRDLARVIDECAPTGPVVLVGHSMGGMTVMSLAAHRPDLFGDRIRGVALIATSAGELASATFRLPRPAATALHRRSDRVAALLAAQHVRIDRGRARTSDLSFLLTQQISFGGPVSSTQVQFIADLLGSTPIEVIAEFLPHFDRHDKAAALDVLGRLPTLVMVGDTDALTPVSHSREIARRVPGAELVVLPHTGHMIITERHREVTERLRRLVDAIRSAPAA